MPRRKKPEVSSVVATWDPFTPENLAILKRTEQEIKEISLEAANLKKIRNPWVQQAKKVLLKMPNKEIQTPHNGTYRLKKQQQAGRVNQALLIPSMASVLIEENLVTDRVDAIRIAKELIEAGYAGLQTHNVTELKKRNNTKDQKIAKDALKNNQAEIERLDQEALSDLEKLLEKQKVVIKTEVFSYLDPEPED
jgi:hypothetical protein